MVPDTGHGVGPDPVVYEPPYLALNDPTVAQPNMVVTFEPTICYSDGGDIFVSIEDRFLITEDGAEWQQLQRPWTSSCRPGPLIGTGRPDTLWYGGEKCVSTGK